MTEEAPCKTSSSLSLVEVFASPLIHNDRVFTHCCTIEVGEISFLFARASVKKYSTFHAIMKPLCDELFVNNHNK